MNTRRSGVFFSALGIMSMCHTTPVDGSDGASATVAGLRCEYKVNPIGIDVLQPRFSWQIEASRRGFVQSAYQIRVATSPAVIIPWTLYLIYGDTRILEDQYESMKSWIGHMQSRAGDNLVWQGDSHFGDWLALSTANPSYPGATTDTDLIATAYFAHSTELVQAIATILQKKEDASTYGKLSQAIKHAFQREFVTPSGRLASNTQTAYAPALAFGLLPDDQRLQAGQRLAQDIRRFRNHITTGFLGTPLLCHVLSDVGLTDVAYDLLLQETYPSWLYPIKMGATTIWERWDGMKPDSSFQDKGMN